MNSYVIRKKSANPSTDQKEIMIDFLRKHPALAAGKFTRSFKYKDAQILWAELANTLNNIPGPRKTWKFWRKTWHDMRCRIKAKSKEYKKYANINGLCENQPPLDPLEISVLKLIKPSTLDECDVKAEASEVLLNTIGNDTEDVSNNVDNPIDPLSVTPPPSVKDRPTTHLEHAYAAEDRFPEYLQRKLAVKEKYYIEKLKIMRASLECQRKTTESLKKIADAIQELL